MTACQAVLPAPARRADARTELLGAAALCLALSLSVQGTLVLAPLLTMHVFDGVLETRNHSTLAVLAATFALAYALGGLLRFLRAGLLAAIAERLGRRLQLHALAASVRVALAGDRMRPALALQDVAELRRLLGGTVLPDLLDLLAIPVALGFLWLLHPLFFLVAAACLAAKSLLAIAADRATRDEVAQATARAAGAAGELTDWLRQRDTVFGLGLLPAVLRRWLPQWLHALHRQDAAQRRAAALQALIQLAGFAQQVAVVVAGAWLVTRRECTPGAMMAATTMAGFATGPVLAVAGRWRDWSHGVLAWRRLLRLARDGAAPAPKPVAAGAAAGLVFDAVTLRPPGAARPLVRDLTLRLAPGEAWALLGPNGVGKTTLLRAAIGLEAPAAGCVLLDGQDTHAAERAALGPRIGYLPQEPQLMAGSVLENIARFGDGGTAWVVAAARRAGAHDVIGRLPQGYDTPAGPGGGLSGGQQRLVALARACHGAPRLLVLDEPEAGLDAAACKSLRDAARAAKAEGTVVLLVTHQPTAWGGVLDGTLRLAPDGGWSAARTSAEAAA